jgi:hypothetical protein
MMRASLKLCSAFALILSAGVVAGCADDSVGSDSAYATDSWSKPTDHGELSFEHKNDASFSDGARYHAWSFTLSDAAEVDLRTVLSEVNLDTIAYLYRRDAESGKWGSHIAKSDDVGGTGASRIKKQLDKGEYMLKVRAIKNFQRGAFVVEAGCAGAGCPTEAATCDPASTFTLASETDATYTCVAVFDAILSTPVTSTFSASVGEADRCAEGALAAKGFDFYKQYWDGFYGWDSIVGDYFDGDPNEVSLNVSVSIHGDAGSQVSVDMGGDEDTVTFVLDANADVVAYYHSEQSPTSAWTCGAYPGAAHPYVDESCMGNAINYLSHELSDVSDEGEGSTTVSSSASLPIAVSKALGYFAEKNAVGAGEPVAYRFTLWGDNYGKAANVELTRGELSRTYRAVNEYSDEVMLVTELTGDAAAMICEQR